MKVFLTSEFLIPFSVLTFNSSIFLRMEYLSEILMSLLNSFVNDKTSEIIKQIKIMQIKKNKMNLQVFINPKHS